MYLSNHFQRVSIMIKVINNFTNVTFVASNGITCEMTIDNVFQDLSFIFIGEDESHEMKANTDDVKKFLTEYFPADYQEIVDMIRLYANSDMLWKLMGL